MKNYPDQPIESEPEEKEEPARMTLMREIIKEILEDDLPECSTNAWFIGSVCFENMLDKMMSRIWENV